MRRETLDRTLSIYTSTESVEHLSKKHGLKESTVRDILKGRTYRELHTAYLRIIKDFIPRDYVPKKAPWEPPIPVTEVYFNGDRISHAHAYELMGRELL